MASELTLLIGSYTRADDFVPTACGEGIVTCAFDPATGRIRRRHVFKDILNPSYLAYDPARREVFAVSENFHGDGSVWQFSCAADGLLTPLAQQNSHGAATCHVAVLPDERVCATSYFGGCLAVFPLENGALAPADRVFHYQGRGANPQRQEASHAHQAVLAPEEKWFYVCDLGADCVWRHDIAAQAEPVGFPMPAGHGPRHMVFHPSLPRAYVLGELTGAVTVCDWDETSGLLDVASTTRVVGDDAAAAAIRVHPSGKALWISLRSTRSFQCFHLDPHGNLSKAADVPPGDGEPRDFTISPDGRWLVSANPSANHLAVTELDPATGIPAGRPVTRFGLGTPCSVLFIPTT